jgi:hypothetical protein
MSQEQIDWLRPRFEQFARGDFSAYSRSGGPALGDEVVELRTWAVDTFREGALVQIELFQARGEALEAAGLRE